ncbi:unnamed protein product, partial [marine sediment metagenome]
MTLQATYKHDPDTVELVATEALVSGQVVQLAD